MNPIEKKEILKTLNEKELRQDLIIPLLSKMGYIAPIEYHGTHEKGKDIICFEYDRLNEQRFLAVVAKTDDLTGNAATNAGLMTVINQVQQAFDSPYEDLYNMRQVNINEVWVMTIGKIISGAQESVINTLRKNNLDKHIRIIGDDRLIQLIDKHFSTFWNSSSETKESVIIQRDRLIFFVEELLISNNVEKSTIESVKSTILYSDFKPRIYKNIDGLHISNVSPYSIELAKIDPEYDDYIVSRTYGVTKDIFQESKKHLSYSFMDIAEIIEHADRISKISNPVDYVSESQDYLLREHPFYRSSYGESSKFVDQIEYLDEGLKELKYFKMFLKHKGKLEWAKELSKSVISLAPEIEKIIENSKEDDIIINYSIDEEKNSIYIEYDTNKAICFTTKFKRIEPKGFERNNDGTLKSRKVINSALFELRDYIEKTLNYDEDKWLQDYVEE